MPIKRGFDSKGCFYQWGSQEKYYYKCGDEVARQKAYDKAREQEIAIISNTNLISVVELKKWRGQVDSSNVDRLMFNDETNELVVKFNDGSIYSYFDVDFNEFLLVLDGAGVCRTNGKNRWGEWWVGKSPSVGAALNRILVRSGKRYKRGGSLR